jgi:hypothetical protein
MGGEKVRGVRARKEISTGFNVYLIQTAGVCEVMKVNLVTPGIKYCLLWCGETVEVKRQNPATPDAVVVPSPSFPSGTAIQRGPKSSGSRCTQKQ